MKHSLHGWFVYMNPLRMERAVCDAEGAVTACSEERDRLEP